MTFERIVIALAFLVLASSASANKEIRLVCHVGNEVGPGGVTYLDDPNCVPSDVNGYFCPDAGKIDLIVVAEKAAENHLENLSHYWDGTSDYDPLVKGATGNGTEDSDGNGVDDGCEIPSECPCWDAIELLQVTAINQADISCSDAAFLYPDFAFIEDNVPYTDRVVQGGFLAYTSAFAGGAGQARCITRELPGFPETLMVVSDDDAAICISQIAVRCADIDDPIVNGD